MNSTYTCAYPADKTIGEMVHLSSDDRRSLCGQEMASTPRRVWRKRNEVEHLKVCKLCRKYNF